MDKQGERVATVRMSDEKSACGRVCDWSSLADGL